MRGGLIESDGETRGGGGAVNPVLQRSFRPRSRSKSFSFGCLASCKFKIRSLTDIWALQ